MRGCLVWAGQRELELGPHACSSASGASPFTSSASRVSGLLISQHPQRPRHRGRTNPPGTPSPAGQKEQLVASIGGLYLTFTRADLAPFLPLRVSVVPFRHSA